MELYLILKIIFVLGVLGFFTLVYAAAHVYAAWRDWKDGRRKW